MNTYTITINSVVTLGTQTYVEWSETVSSSTLSGAIRKANRVLSGCGWHGDFKREIVGTNQYWYLRSKW